MGLNVQELNGKSAIVTGASRGIGAAAARELARHGVHFERFERAIHTNNRGIPNLHVKVATFELDQSSEDLIDLEFLTRFEKSGS